MTQAIEGLEAVPNETRKRPAKAKSGATKAPRPSNGKALRVNGKLRGFVVGGEVETAENGRATVLSFLSPNGSGPLGARLRVKLADGKIRLLKPETAKAV